MTKKVQHASGAIFKFTGDIHGWKNIILREVNITEDGAYLIKADGKYVDNNKIEQVQLLFTERDAANISHCLEIHLKKSDSGKQALKLTREVHAVNNPDYKDNDTESIIAELESQRETAEREYRAAINNHDDQVRCYKKAQNNTLVAVIAYLKKVL